MEGPVEGEVKDRPIGELFEFEGVKLQVKGTGHNSCCDGCYFDDPYHKCWDMSNPAQFGYCYWKGRRDHKNVIFVEV